MKWSNNSKYTDSNLPDQHKYLLEFIHKDNEIFMNNKQNSTRGKRKLNKYEKEAIETLEEE